MGKQYEEAPDLRPLVERVMRAHHPHLTALEVVIDLLWAFEGSMADPMPTLARRGGPLFGVAAVESLRERVRGAGDARIEVDRGRWIRLSEPEQEAVIDGLLEQIEPVISENHARFDDLGRPRLRIRPPDVELSAWIPTAARHGRASTDVRAALALLEGPYGPLLFPDVVEAGRVHAQAVTAGRAEPLAAMLAFSRFDIGGLREDLEKERQHAELRAARRRAAEAPGVTIEIGRGKRPGKG